MADTAADEAEIRRLVEKERQGTRAGDFAYYSSKYVHAPYAGRWHASRVTGIFAFQGWDQIAPRMEASAAARRVRPLPVEDPGIVENLQIRVSGDIGWLTYARRYDAPPDYRASSGPAHHLRILERQNGEWKFVFSGFLDPGTTGPESSRLRLSEDGTVLWMDPGVGERLAADDDLTIRAGKLRIRDARANQKLGAAIAWAAGLDRGVIPGRGALPIMLERGEDLPTRVWWVFADSGAIYFSLGDARRDAERLDLAAVVFGLSAAQRQVAGHIVEGLSLPEIARAMGVRPSTVRTHLVRMFEKLGVRNQTALVRMLLSVAAPL